MKGFTRRGDFMRSAFSRLATALLLICSAVHCGASKPNAQPLVLSARLENGKLTYRLNGKVVEDSVQNSLLMNLGRIVRTRGTDFPVWIIIDVRAPFSEVGKLETALDKSDLTQRRIFISNFTDRFMNEIHWDERAVPLPKIPDQ